MHIEAGFPRILLEAEISNLSRPASGHLYFTLKDEKAQVRCALFRSSAARLTINPENGMKVLARGRISLYEARGDFQMIVDGLQHAGEGLLRQQFEALKKKLEAEGLFDERHKKPLPLYPGRIAVITSPSGAAIRDVLHVLERRWPLARVRIYPVPVQGEEAPAAITCALQAANAHRWADVMIMGRGGGSLEDLWAFNDEGLARAIHDSDIPLVSAVGHETDFSISDYVADLRAPTPSAAAEMITPDSQMLAERFSRLERQIQTRTMQILHSQAQRLDHVAHRLEQCHPRRQLDVQQMQLGKATASLHQAMLRSLSEHELALKTHHARLQQVHPGKLVLDRQKYIESLSAVLEKTITQRLVSTREHLGGLARTLHAVSPLQTISRGYAVVLEPDTETAITSVAQLKPDDPLITQLADGQIYSRVERLSDQTLDGEQITDDL